MPTLSQDPGAEAGRTASLSVEDARAIARDAYVYGFPLVDSYRVQHAYFVDTNDPEYKGAWNEVHSSARVFTPEDRAIQTPNSDTPYSMVGCDLRTEPLVITVPEVEAGRYYSLQLIDAYTHNFAYVGSRATGNGAGSFVLAGPGWRRETHEGVKAVIRCETEIALGIFRTQLFNPDDLENVKRVQAGYRVQPLSQFLRRPAPPPAPAIDFVQPLSPADQRGSLRFFEVLNFVLRFCPTHPSETELMARFARLGVGAGLAFDPDRMPAEIRQACHDGLADAWTELEGVAAQMDTGKVTSGDVFGTRAHLAGRYDYRMLGAVKGIYGNSADEAIYPPYMVDADGQPMDGRQHSYQLRLTDDALPPVHAFWSLTLYEMPQSLLSANRLNRYLINSPMLPDLKRDADGAITLYIQHQSPGADLEPNWLPAPAGPFACAMRLYWPKPEALDGRWKAPPMRRVN